MYICTEITIDQLKRTVRYFIKITERNNDGELKNFRLVDEDYVFM